MNTRDLLVAAAFAFFATSVHASISTVSTDISAFRLDTRSVPVVDASGSIQIAYADDIWGEDGAGATANISAQYAVEQSQMIGSNLSGIGLFSWRPDKNGFVTISLVSGSVTIEKQLEVINVKHGFILILQ